MHCLASCGRPTVTCHLPWERNCPNPLNFLHGQDKVGSVSWGRFRGRGIPHPTGDVNENEKKWPNQRREEGSAPTTVGSSGRETLRAVKGAQRRRAVSFSLFSQPCTVIHREVAACGFILSQSDYRSGASSSCGLCLSSVLPRPRPSVCLLPGPSSLQSTLGGASERVAYNPQSSFLASELTSHTRRRRPTPSSAAHDSLTHEAEEARLPVWQLGPLQDGEHLPPRDARLGRRRTGRLRATQAERRASATAGRVGFKA